MSFSVYSLVAPLSTPVSASEPSLVMWSLLSVAAEVSCASATPGSAAVASDVSERAGPVGAVERVLDSGASLDAGKRQRAVLGDVVAVVGVFFNDTATTEIYTLSLHDALPI